RRRVPERAPACRLGVGGRGRQTGRCSGRRRNVTDDGWNAFDLDDLRLASGIAEDLRGRFGRTPELRRVVAGVADRGDADERLELRTNPRHVLADAVAQRCGGRLRLHGGSSLLRPRSGRLKHNAKGSISLRVNSGTTATLTET